MVDPQPPRQVQRSRLSDQVADMIRDDVLTGQLPIGTHLSQVEWAERLGVSRMPVRDAINQLVAEGMLIQSKNGSATVARVDADDVRDGYYLSAVLAQLCAQHAAARMTTEQLDALEAIHEEMEAKDPADRAGLSELNMVFHRQINKASGSPRLLALLRMVSTSIPHSAFRQVEDWPEVALREHAAIIEALRGRHAQIAGALMFEHIEHGSKLMLDEVTPRLSSGNDSAKPGLSPA